MRVKQLAIILGLLLLAAPSRAQSTAPETVHCFSIANGSLHWTTCEVSQDMCEYGRLTMDTGAVLVSPACFRRPNMVWRFIAWNRESGAPNRFVAMTRDNCINLQSSVARQPALDVVQECTRGPLPYPRMLAL